MADNSNIFDFNDPTFSSTFCKLNQYRNENKLTDVELQIGDKLFPAHRAVLSVGSPVLEAAFSENWTQSKIYPIGDEYVDPGIVEDLLGFLYTGSIQLTPDNVYPVCVAAHFLQMTTLLEASVNWLSKLITVENVLTLLVFSNSLSLKVLNESCLTFISINYPKLFQKLQILHFSIKDFTDLIVELKSQFFGTTLREDTFYCVIRWTEFNLLERSMELPALLENIPLDEMSFRFLTRTVFTHPLVKEFFPCIQNILKTLKLPSFETVPEQNPSTLQGLIVIGGRKSSDEYSSMINYYHANSQTWRRLPDMLHKRSAFSVAVSNRRDIIVSGGYVEVNGHSQQTGSVEMFSWESHTWQKLPDMPMSMIGHSTAIHNGHLYVAGGHQNGKLLSNVWRFSFEKREWSNVQNMNYPHTNGSLVSYKDHLYAIGAITELVERYDSIGDEWKLMASMRTWREFVRATVHRDKIYAAGDDIFEVYDPETNVWSSLPVWPIVGSASLVSLNDKLLAIGHVSEWKHTSSIYEFDLDIQNWVDSDISIANLNPHYAVVVNKN